jgi:hypothetical protein
MKLRGKDRLVKVLYNMARQEGAEHVQGTCDIPYYKNMTYKLMEEESHMPKTHATSPTIRI